MNASDVDGRRRARAGDGGARERDWARAMGDAVRARDAAAFDRWWIFPSPMAERGVDGGRAARPRRAEFAMWAIGTDD